MDGSRSQIHGVAGCPSGLAVSGASASSRALSRSEVRGRRRGEADYAPPPKSPAGDGRIRTRCFTMPRRHLGRSVFFMPTSLQVLRSLSSDDERFCLLVPLCENRQSHVATGGYAFLSSNHHSINLLFQFNAIHAQTAPPSAQRRMGE